MSKLQIAKEKAAVLRLAQIIVQRLSGNLTDAEALSAPVAFEPWAADRPYGKDQIIRHGDTIYRVVQAVEQSQAHQPPDAEGMLAIYRPIVPTAAGTLADPIPWVYGMDCTTGNYYTHEGKTYKCAGDMLPCVWAPGTAGLWQWEVVA